MKYEHILVTNFAQRCSLIWCEQTRSAAWIDPGGDVKKLIAHAEKKELEFKKVILTHGHADHIAGAKPLAEHYGIPIVGPHHDDKFLFDALPVQCQMFGLPQTPAFLPTKWLRDHDTLIIGQEKLSVLHCPGHTPGHVVLVSHKENVAFCGDVLFKQSIGRTDFPLSNHADLIHSIKTKLFTLPDNTIVVPGHGELTTIGDEKAHNPFLKSY